MAYRIEAPKRLTARHLAALTEKWTRITEPDGSTVAYVPDVATATMMAAAPALLAALKEAEQTLTALGFDGDLGDMPAPVLDNARLAIQDATSESQP